MRYLNATNRCDRCNAQAYVAVTLTSGGLLMFCNHDWQRVKHVITPMVADLIDETEALHQAIVDDRHTVG
jgi:hypothetical protein